MTHPTPHDRIDPVSPDSTRSAPDPGKNSRQEAAGATNANTLDPRHPPRRKRRRPILLLIMALLLMGVGQAAWPVIDISSVTQLIKTVNLATSTLNEMTAAKQVLLGQVAILTGTWSDLTGAAYGLGEKASSLVTDYSLTQIETGITDRRAAMDLAWPSDTDVRDAYTGEPAAVIRQVLRAHQAETARHEAERSAWNDAQIVIAQAGEFLEDVETTSGNQNTETTQGLGAQLDRHIAVSSAARDIAARQLEMAVSAEHRAARLEHQQALHRARQVRRAVELRSEMRDAIDDHAANFDAAAFDRDLYTPVLPSYGP